MSNSNFQKNFKFAMDCLGLPVPATAFATVKEAVGSISALTGVVAKFGTRVTVGELVGAGSLSEIFLVASGCVAAFYCGACIGALLYAIEQEAESKLAASVMQASFAGVVAQAKATGVEVPSGSPINHMMFAATKRISVGVPVATV